MRLIATADISKTTKNTNKILRTFFHSIIIYSGEIKPGLGDSPDKHQNSNAACLSHARWVGTLADGIFLGINRLWKWLK